ncbi:MAG: MBL fold metallo-hydrolase [bacterium]|nr:MBL fold metallo-hydrolase [bacterium]
MLLIIWSGQKSLNPQPLQTNYAYHIGHSTVFLCLDSVHVLIDPTFNDIVYFRKRDNPPALGIKDLPAVDLVLLSHGHWDHMDMGSLEQIIEKFPSARIYLPVRLGKYLKQEGIRNYTEVSNDQQFQYGPLLIRTYRMNHYGDRYIIDNTPLTLGYTIKGTRTVFFAGDSGYDSIFKRIGAEAEIDLAFVESHGWHHTATNTPDNPDRPRGCGYSGCVSLFRLLYKSDNLPQAIPRHLQADETLEVLQDLKAKKMVPIHYDTFTHRYSDELDFSDPLGMLKQMAAEKDMADRIIFDARGKKIIIE